jgi:hypothetical protein
MTNQGRLMCRQSDRRFEPPNNTEQTGNKRTIRVLPKPDKLISYRHMGMRREDISEPVWPADWGIGSAI